LFLLPQNAAEDRDPRGQLQIHQTWFNPHMSTSMRTRAHTHGERENEREDENERERERERKKERERETRGGSVLDHVIVVGLALDEHAHGNDGIHLLRLPNQV
jgi:hypothetical protein